MGPIPTDPASTPVPAARPRRRLRVRLVRLGVILLVAWLGLSYLVATKLTRRRSPPFAEPVPSVGWAAFEARRLRTTDGFEIGAWYAPAARAGAPGVVLIHGNGGNRGHVLSRAETLTRAGCAVLLISLRAHGDSTGEVNDIGFGARHDVAAAVRFLEGRRPGAPVVLLGTSLGAAASLFAARELGPRVHGYILESPYRDLRTAVWHRVENDLPPVLDRIAYRGLVTVAPLVLPHLDLISPLRAIADVPPDVPILILAGTDDPVARPHEAEDLHRAAGSRSTLHLFEGAGHIQMIQTDPARYHAAVFDLLGQAEALARRRAAGPPGGDAPRAARD